MIVVSFTGVRKLEELWRTPKPIEAAQNDGDNALVDEWYEYQFEWDASKAQRNARDHKVTFEEAAEVFADANALSLFDTEHSNGEDRWITLGIDQAGRLLVVCHTFQELSETRARVRIFSARRTTKGERRSYQKHDL